MTTEAQLSFNDFFGPGARALITTRHGGLSRGPFRSFNMSLSVGDDPEVVLTHRRRALELLGAEQLAVASLCHGDEVLEVTQGGSDLPLADALITRTPGLALGVTSADCLPIYLYDPVARAVGLVHAGWRGTALGIAGKTVQALAATYGSRPADLYALIGPGIGPCCFEVKADVAEPLLARYGPGVVEPKAERWLADLWAANRADLLQAGVLADHLRVTGLCTACRTDQFYSHRAEAGRTGRQIALLTLVKGVYA